MTEEQLKKENAELRLENANVKLNLLQAQFNLVQLEKQKAEADLETLKSSETDLPDCEHVL